MNIRRIWILSYNSSRAIKEERFTRLKRDYDTRISQHNYEVGDLVYCVDLTKSVGHCKKIDPNIWRGPFVIVRKFSDLLFEIQGKPGTRSKLFTMTE